MVLWFIALAAAAAVIIRSRFWPYARCRACVGRKGRGIGSTDRAYNRCRRCGGDGERIRPLSLIWPAHRQAARQRKQQRSSR